MKKCWSVLIALLCIGCARPYAQYYHDMVQGADTSNAIFTTEEPKLLQGNINNIEGDNLQMIENGYGLLGYSSFTGPQQNQNQAIAKAK